MPPPPQVWGEVQVPQLAMVPPQPSDAAPHVRPCCAQVRGVQVCGGVTSGWMHEERSKMRYSNTFSCGVSGAAATCPEK